MSTLLNPYLTFPGNARAAMELYASVLGGTPTISTFGEYGGGEGVDPQGVMHAHLQTPSGFTLMASDMPPGMEHQPGNNLAISLSGDEPDQLRAWFSGLADGGTVVMPLEKQVWGDEFGMCLDRFGVQWMVNIAGSAA